MMEKPPAPRVSCYILWLWLLILPGSLAARHKGTDADTIPYRPRRLAAVIAADVAVYGGAMGVLYGVWYKDHDLVPFHWHNDNAGWMKIDKAGHAFSAYVEGYYGYHSLRWAGVPHKKAAIYGGGIGVLMQTAIEALDGLSEGWGASPGDLIANTGGSLLFTGQELLWQEQRIKMKFSYSPTIYPALRPSYFGTSGMDNFLRDYNGHTYWLSASPGTFFTHSRWPRWLALAAGFGADGMLAEYDNPGWYRGAPLPHFERQRQLYLALDIDLGEIPTKSKFLRGLFRTINIIKVPAPALAYGFHSGWRMHELYF